MKKHFFNKFTGILCAAICTLYVGTAVAQTDDSYLSEPLFETSGGIKLNMPLANLKETNKTGVGFDLQGELRPWAKASFIFNVGLTFFRGKDSKDGTYDGKNVGYIPFLGGARYYITPGFFIGGQVGYGLYQDGFLKGPNAGGFNYTPQIGFNSQHGQIYFYYSSTNAKFTSGEPVGDLLPGQINHIGGSIIFKGITSMF